MAQPNKPGKTMSSRLATMKFMQRASASPASAPSTPTEYPSKKQRLSNGSYNSTPASAPSSDAQAIEKALAAEEQKRTEALEREAAHRGESKWYLSIREPQVPAAESPMHIVSAGYSTLDTAQDRFSEEEGEGGAVPQVTGRRSFGKINRVVEKQQNPDRSTSDSDSSSDSSENNDDEEDDSDDPTGAKAMIAQSRKAAGEKARAERKAKKQAEKTDATRLAEQRRKKQVKLNKLSSISSADATSNRPSAGRSMTCFACGEKGHGQRDCTQSSQQRPKRS